METERRRLAKTYRMATYRQASVRRVQRGELQPRVVEPLVAAKVDKPPIVTTPIYVDPPHVKKLEKNKHAQSFDFAPIPATRRRRVVTKKIVAVENPTSRSRTIEKLPESPASDVLKPKSHEATQKPVHKKGKRRFSWLSSSKGLYALAIAIALVGIGVSVQGFFVNKQAIEQVTAIAEKKNDSDKKVELPSEAHPTDPAKPTKNYNVASDLPRSIQIPKLGVNARVLALSVKADNQMDTPKNIYDTAWYSGSAKPGDAGATVINGHVSGPTRHGVFYGIKKLVRGDKIIVEKGDKSTLSYRVERVETVAADKVDMMQLLNTSITGISGLNLITCGGAFDTSTNKYIDRILVFAVKE